MSPASASLEDFDGIFQPSPSMDWTRLSVADDLKQLEKQVDQFEAAATSWRASATSRLSKLNPNDLNSASETATASSQLAATIQAVEDGIKAHSQPLHSNPTVAQKLEQIAALSSATGRFIRKLLRRVERIRVAQHATHIDMYYGLLAIQSELEGNKADSDSFRDPAKLGAFLRNQMA